MKARRISASAKRKQLAGSRKGSAAVRDAFGEALTRRRFCDLVGIHPKTLSKWERQGVVKPQTAVIMNSPTRVFSVDDVEFGQSLIAFLHDNPGLYSVTDAAEVVRRRPAAKGGRQD